MHSTDEAARVPAAPTSTVPEAAPSATGLPAALVVATATSVAAGLVHAVAAGSHTDDRTLAWMFTLVAVAQLAWAGVAALRPARAVLLAGALLNGGALVVWALTRTVGIGFVDSLAGTEPVTVPDLTAAVLAGASVVGVVALLGGRLRLFHLNPIWAGLVAAVILATAAPAMTSGDTHSGADHHGGDGELALAHGDGEEHADGVAHAEGEGEEHADGADHPHTEGEEHADGADHPHADGETHVEGVAHAHDDGDAHDPADPAHAHDAADPTHPHDPTDPAHTTDPAHPHDPTDPTHPPTDPAHPHDPTDPTHPPTDPTHPHDPNAPIDPHPTDPHPPTHPHPTDPGPVISLDDPRLNDAQRAAATQLIDITRTGMGRFTDVASVRAAGYTSIGDASTGYEHFVHFGFLNDASTLDPDRIESVVFQVNPDGSKTLVSAMYILSQGKTLADAPDIAGELTTWHDHQDLCWSVNASGHPIVVAIRPPGGSCPPGSIFVATPPMLHVWMVENPCGPFAGIETDGAQGPHGQSCLHDAH